MIDCHSLYVPSLSSIAEGPVHTYQCNTITTTLDYVLSNLATSQILASCCILDDDPLNTSDHLPIVTRFTLDQSIMSPPPPSSGFVPLNWNRGHDDGSTSIYATRTDNLVRPLLGKDYSSVQEIENDLFCD